MNSEVAPIGETPHGKCQSCHWPMRKYNEKPFAYAFPTRLRGNELLCIGCRRSAASPQISKPEKVAADIAAGLKWVLDYNEDRARRGIPPEGIVFEGEELKSGGRKKAGTQ